MRGMRTCTCGRERVVVQIKCIDASSLQESVRDALRGCGQDLGEEWRRTQNNWAISLVLALWSWIRTQPFTLARYHCRRYRNAAIQPALYFIRPHLLLRRSKVLLMRSRLGTSMGRALVASATHMPDVVKVMLSKLYCTVNHMPW